MAAHTDVFRHLAVDTLDGKVPSPLLPASSLLYLDNWQADQYHHIHHATFESNYGSPFSAFIDQFFGTFRERLGKSKAYRGESSGADVDADPALAKKNDDVKTTKVWSATGYLGLPKSWDHAVYTAFWMSLFPLVWWGAISNQSADGLLVSMIGPVATSKVIAFIVAYAPVILVSPSI